MFAMSGTGPARLASSKCHDFTAEHGFSSGVKGRAVGRRREKKEKKKNPLVSQIAG